MDIEDIVKKKEYIYYSFGPSEYSRTIIHTEEYINYKLQKVVLFDEYRLFCMLCFICAFIKKTWVLTKDGF